MDNATDQQARPASGGPAFKRILGQVGWILPFVTVALAYCYYFIFSHMAGDDEGYLMITVKGFIEGHPLYDSVFTQYGPFYYFYEQLLHGTFAVPLTHDATRLICIAHWIAAALLLGLSGGILMRSLAGGIFVFMQAIVHLTGIASEPGHPQELVALLLATSILVATKPTAQLAPLGLLATIGAFLVFLKVNVGVFFVMALLLAMFCHSPHRFAAGSWLRFLRVLCACIPFLLMRRHLGEPWCRNYAILASLTIAMTFVISGQFANRQPVGPSGIWRLSLGFLIPTAVTLSILLGKGTSLVGCLDGLLLTPLRMPSVALLPILLPTPVLANALVSLLVAGAVWREANHDRFSPVISVLKGLYGLTGCLALALDAPAQFAYLLPWIWLLLVPSGIGVGRAPRPTFPRTFLCLLAACQSLQAYPIAGTQVTVATFVLVLVSSLCLWDAWMAFRDSEILQWYTSQVPARPVALLRILEMVALLYLFAMVWCQPHLLRRSYASLAPLNLPGARSIRLPQENILSTQTLMRYLETQCDTFVTYPGFNSFYFWTGKQPPTQLNSTGWGQLTPDQQKKILNALIQVKRPLLVVHEFVTRGWGTTVPDPIRTLVEFVRNNCQEATRIGPYIIYVPNRASLGK